MGKKARLPAGFVEEHRPVGVTMTMFGQKLEDLTREELMACIAYLRTNNSPSLGPRSWMGGVD